VIAITIFLIGISKKKLSNRLRKETYRSETQIHQLFRENMDISKAPAKKKYNIN
jgi:guanylate kinase